MSKKTDRYPNAKSYRDRHGRVRWRYRQKGFSAELGTEWGSEDFQRRYADAVNRDKLNPGAGASRTKPGTFDDLVARFYELHFPSIEPSTRKTYRGHIEPLRAKHGKKRVAHMRRRHVLEIKADLFKTPTQANNVLKRLSQLMELAIELEWRTDNPVRGVTRYQIEGGGFHTWDEGEIARFYEVQPFGSTAYLAMTLMLYTGAARVDVVKLGKANVRDGRIIYRRQKTRKNPKGILVDIPIHPFLAQALETVPEDAFTFLQTRQGKARTKSGLGTRMRQWCDAAGLPMCSSHGLRKAICRRLAEAGATAPEIMAVSGHITLSEVQPYIETYGRKAMADSAIGKLPRGAEPVHKLTNRPARFVNSVKKAKENK